MNLSPAGIRFCWASALVGFQILSLLQCCSAHRKVPQRKSRQVEGSQEPGDVPAGVWSTWGPWSACSTTCGVGVTRQSRRCMRRDPEVPWWPRPSPEVLPPPPQPHQDGGWGPYTGRSVSAVMPTYPLHVDSEQSTYGHRQTMPLHTQQEPTVSRREEESNHLSAPLYGPGYSTNWPESRAYRGPTNEDSRYGHLANRGSVPLYRQRQPSNQNRRQHAASRNPASPYWGQGLTNRESTSLYVPEGSSNQGVGSGSRPRQRNVPYWRGSTGNRRSLWLRQEPRAENRSIPGSARSLSRSGIRPGQYGYGKVPANFRPASSPRESLRDWRDDSSGPRLPKTRPRAEERRRARREAGAGGRGEAQDLDLQSVGGQASDDSLDWLNQTSWSRQADSLTDTLSSPEVPARIGPSPEGPRRRASWQVSHLGPGWRRQSRRPWSRGRGWREKSPRVEPAYLATTQPANGSHAHSGGSQHRPRPLGRHKGSEDPGNRRSRRQDYRATGQPRPDWDSSPTPPATCAGVETQYKVCTLQACPSGMSDPRREQCAGFNHLQFMGRYYKWEPFTEVRKEQQCELNCRPAGYRFYVRHADHVLDGTPCETNSSDVCVAGSCLAAGCDGTLGSGTKVDKCGVCGGDSSSCRVVFGTFEDSHVSVGYHKIIQIPTGATHINVTELGRSRNYLALRSQSGRSIINGNWAIDRPGKYEAAGTVFMYKRPTESNGESFYAEGPTTESLDVYMIFQQENPGIHYQFIMPVEMPALPDQNLQPPSQGFGSWTPGNRREVSALGSGPTLSYPGGAAHPRTPTHRGGTLTPRVRGGQRDRRLQEDPSRTQPTYSWRAQGVTECSASCGRGFQFSVSRCVDLRSWEPVEDGLCSAATRPANAEEPCNTQPCPAFWSVGNWSECSRSCGGGSRHRQVLCRQAYASQTVAVHPHHCRHLDKPNSTQPCQAQPCTHWQIQTDWESCSVPCGVGQRKRSIRCVSNQGAVVGEAECKGKQKPSDSEVCDMGPCVSAWFYTDWASECSVECGVGVQKRSVHCLSHNLKDNRSPGQCEGPQPPDTRACTRGQCQHQIRWFASPWNKCPVECGNGTQNRDLICVIKQGNDFTVTDMADCKHLVKPATLQPCSAGPCRPRWFTTGWSECSKTCRGGLQTRDVRCLDDARSPSSLCKDEEEPVHQRVCHTHPCMPELDANCKDSYHNCVVVVQARLCVYSYYKMVCCASCTHAERRSRGQRTGSLSRRAGA
ncbi:thrombospondin type-1 domain-containing protein 4-like isoform X2 [Narcine bancroftii]|uniref:thrombospondin type-1 domain-containing protein 4-like isoform X2 n=1 Tax=Narcine bancroftii TaxID=1343680 RepID=UPI00383231B7